MTTPFPLGRNVEHDPRSRAFAFAPATTVPLATKVWRRYGNVLDQGNVGACTGFAMAHTLNSKPNYVAGEGTLKNADGLRLYSRATSLDEFPGEYPPTDTGSSGLGVSKAAMEFGYITRYDWAFGFDAYLQALMHSPVAVGAWWYNAMFYPDANGFVRPEGGRAGGHEFVGVGIYSLRDRVLVFQNSWSNLWGVNGRFFMTFDDFANLLLQDGDAVIPVGGPWS